MGKKSILITVGSISERNLPAVAKVPLAQTQEFFYRGAQSGRHEIMSDSAGEYSSGEEVETEGERQTRVEKARADIQTRIQTWK